MGGEQEQAVAVEQREERLKTKYSIVTNLLETLAKLVLKVTALQQEQDTSNHKQTVGAKVAPLARACFIARSLAPAEDAEKSKNQYGLMGNCSRKLEEDKERRMAIIILVYYITPSYLIFYFPGLSKGCYLVRISISGLDVSAALRQ